MFFISKRELNDFVETVTKAACAEYLGERENKGRAGAIVWSSGGITPSFSGQLGECDAAHRAAKAAADVEESCRRLSAETYVKAFERLKYLMEDEDARRCAAPDWDVSGCAESRECLNGWFMFLTNLEIRHERYGQGRDDGWETIDDEAECPVKMSSVTNISITDVGMPPRMAQGSDGSWSVYGADPAVIKIYMQNVPNLEIRVERHRADIFLEHLSDIWASEES